MRRIKGREELALVSDKYPELDLKNFPDRQKLLIKGEIDQVGRHALKKSPNKIAVGVVYLRVQNRFLRCIVFPSNYKKLAQLLEEGKTVYVFGCLIKDNWDIGNMKKRNQNKYLSKIIKHCQVDVRGVLGDYLK